jgi:Transglycosylase SLT domain
MTTWRDGANAAQWIPVISTAEVKNDIPTGLSSRQCYQESRFNPYARNAASGAVGLFQLLPQYFPGAGVNSAKDIGTATAYLASLAKRFGGDWQLGLAAYDWGPGSVDNWQKHGGNFAMMPQETQNYVTQIVADVPVEGILCKTPTLPSPQPTGFPTALSQPEIPSEAPSRSLFSRLSSRFTRRGSVTTTLLSPSPHSAPSLPRISSPTTPIAHPEVSMSAPNPFEQAALPFAKSIVTSLQSLVNGLSSDPVTAAQQLPGALQILLGQIQMQFPSLGTAEFGAAKTVVSTQLGGVITKIDSLMTAAPTKPA